MKKFFAFSFLIVLFALWFGFRYLNSPIDPASVQTKQIIIRSGSNVTQIANLLARRHLIRSPLMFRFQVRLHHLDSQIQAGLFKLSPKQTPSEIALTLTHGQLDRWLTIPEGYRREQIAELLKRDFKISSSDFLNLTRGQEGKLFPDTYLIPLDVSPRQIVALLLKNYRRRTQPLSSLFAQTSLTENQVLTLASIVERETLSNQEKPIVAGILLKRIRHHWPLQVDATIQYILGKPGNWWPVPSVADRQLKSPYNTYLHQGLPPTPIANPGLASIKAVLQPQTTPYWFYLHDHQGKIHYAVTSGQHQANIKRYLK